MKTKIQKENIMHEELDISKYYNNAKLYKFSNFNSFI